MRSGSEYKSKKKAREPEKGQRARKKAREPERPGGMPTNWPSKHV